jgi:hypothetical protein
MGLEIPYFLPIFAVFGLCTENDLFAFSSQHGWLVNVTFENGSIGLIPRTNSLNDNLESALRSNLRIMAAKSRFVGIYPVLF